MRPDNTWFVKNSIQCFFLSCELKLEPWGYFNDTFLVFPFQYLDDKDKLYNLAYQKGETMTNPWFGQLMMGPQFIAYLYSIYLWGKIYQIKLQL